MPKSNSPALPLLVLVLVFAAALWAAQWANRPNVQLPRPLPELTVAGWLNTEKPITGGLEGQWVVIDCWATWCGPCLAAMPELAAFRDQWQGRGVTLLGITAEGLSAKSEIEDVIAGVEGFDWPVAYGGEDLFNHFDIASIPTLILISPAGEAVWQGHRVEELTAAVEEHVGAR